MARFLFPTILLLVLLPAGCAGPPGPVSSSPDGRSAPLPGSDYAPRKAYDLGFPAAWEGALEALRGANMPLAQQDREKGILRTEYIKGPDLQHPGKALSTRYKYNVFFFRESERRTILNIRCLYEVREKGAPQFRDAGGLYPDEVIALEKDLYRIVESSLLPLEASGRAGPRGTDRGKTPAAPPGTSPSPERPGEKEAIIFPPPSASAPAAPKIFLVTRAKADLREEPSPQAKIVLTLKPGRKVEKTGESGNWVRVRIWGTTTGWVQKELLGETVP